MKRITTVTGDVRPEELRMVLSHEHLFIDLRHQAPADALERPLTAADRPALMCDPYMLRDNLVLDDFAAAADECRMLAEQHCDTVVDCSTDEIGRDPAKLAELSRQTGIKIVMGCGNYTGDTHSEEFRAGDEGVLAEKLIAEIDSGIGGVRPGIIGEIGTSREILPSERKALRIAGRAQKHSGLAVQVHIYPWSANGLEALKELEAQGVAPDRIVICHSDVTPDKRYIRELLNAGVYVQLDNFGKEFTPRAGGFAAGAFARDSERAELAAWIIDSGFGDQLLLTNDVCLKCMLKSRGGAGYCRIFADIVPMIAALGVPEEYLKGHILHDNPVAMLCR